MRLDQGCGSPQFLAAAFTPGDVQTFAGLLPVLEQISAVKRFAPPTIACASFEFGLERAFTTFSDLPSPSKACSWDPMW